MGPISCLLIYFITTVPYLNVQGYNTSLKVNSETLLTKKFLDEYKSRGKYGRPLSDVNSTIKVNFGLTLLQIMDLDEKNQVLTLNVWDHYEWNDTFMSWNPDHYDGVVSIRLPYQMIWRPDITLYNYADERIQDHRDSFASVDYTGLVKWNPQAMYKSSCKIEIMRFPFDTQQCELKFGSWTYSAQMMDIYFVDGAESFDISQYIINNEWAVEKNSAHKNEQVYKCCQESFQDLTFYLKLRRMSDLYSYILVIPCVLLSSLTLVLFWIPPQSPAKVQLGINIFVAFFVMMLILEESIPTAADSVPMIGKFYMMNMILITLSSFLTVLVANIALSTNGRPVPRLARKIFVELLGKALCVHKESSPKPIDSNNRCEEATYLKLTKHHKPNQPLDFKTLPKLEQDVEEIKRGVRSFVEKMMATDWKARTAREWSVVACVIDRFLFGVYLIVILCSFMFLFPLD